MTSPIVRGIPAPDNIAAPQLPGGGSRATTSTPTPGSPPCSISKTVLNPDRTAWGGEWTPEKVWAAYAQHFVEVRARRIAAGDDPDAESEARLAQVRAARLVYFIQNGGLVKIGVSICPEERLASLRTAAPFARLITSVPGGNRLERTLHAEFSAWCVGGEWFEDSQELRDRIAELVARQAE